MKPIEAANKILDLKICYQIEINERKFLRGQMMPPPEFGEFQDEEEKLERDNKLVNYQDLTDIITSKDTLLLYEHWYVAKEISKEKIFFTSFDVPRQRTSILIDSKKFELSFKCTEIPLGDIVFQTTFPLIHVKDIYLSKTKNKSHVIVETSHGKCAVPIE